MIRSGILVTAPRRNDRTKAVEMQDVDIIDLTDAEFAEYWITAEDEKERFIIANTLRRCCVGLSDFGDQGEAP